MLLNEFEIDLTPALAVLCIFWIVALKRVDKLSNLIEFNPVSSLFPIARTPELLLFCILLMTESRLLLSLSKRVLLIVLSEFLTPDDAPCAVLLTFEKVDWKSFSIFLSEELVLLAICLASSLTSESCFLSPSKPLGLTDVLTSLSIFFHLAVKSVVSSTSFPLTVPAFATMIRSPCMS
ncbi:hypothetical protein DSECCO2_631680 [anaerobic digester metagenome]